MRFLTRCTTPTWYLDIALSCPTVHTPLTTSLFHFAQTSPYEFLTDL